jgi:hypothetical protein
VIITRRKKILLKMVFVLDNMSSEVLNMIFDYLWGNEIFYSLYDLSPYLNNVIYNYKNYYLNFENFHKKTYDKLLISLKENIKCLIISNDESIPHFLHIKNILLDFNFSEFLRLEKLSLININEEYFLDILPNISKFRKLKCLKLDRLPSYTGIRFNRVLKQLTRLDLPDATFFDHLSEESIINLKSLSVGHCTFIQLKHIFSILPKYTFKSFALTNGIISTIGDNHWPLFHTVPKRITKINLQIDCKFTLDIQLKGLFTDLNQSLYRIDVTEEVILDGGFHLIKSRRLLLSKKKQESEDN